MKLIDLKRTNNTIPLLFASEMNQGNFGDLLSRYIVEKISGLRVEKYNHKIVEPHLDAIGSILDREEICSPVIIWGSGFLSPQPLYKIKLTKWKQFFLGKYGHPKVLAVRGLLTQNILLKAGIKCPNVYGDPALLMPKFYSPQVKDKKYKLGIVLHKSHEVYADKFLANDVKIIKIDRTYRNIESFVDECVECDAILSSSLHGLIIANAYKIPCVRLKIKDLSIHAKPKREDFKFNDYLSGLNSYKVGNNYLFYKYNYSIDSEFKCQDVDFILENATVPQFELHLNELLFTFKQEVCY